MHVLTIGGVPISVESSDAISQSYESIGGVTTLRTMRGAGIRQRNWRRLSTTISVSDARFLPALQSLDLDAPQVIQCLAPRQIAGTTRAVVLPAARRADIEPYGFAVLPSGFVVPVAGTLNAHTLTLDAVPGAVRYTACYVPEFTGLITEFTEQFDVRGAVAGWQIKLEEI